MEKTKQQHQQQAFFGEVWCMNQKQIGKKILEMYYQKEI